MSQHKLEKGFHLHQQGELVDAKILYEEFLSENPDHFDALHLLGLLAHEISGPQEAERHFLKAIGLKSDFAQIYISYATALRQMGRLEEELACYDRAIKIDADYLDALFGRAVVLQCMNRLDEALVNYDRTLLIDPEHVETLSNRGLVLLGLGRMEEAVASLRD